MCGLAAIFSYHTSVPPPVDQAELLHIFAKPCSTPLSITGEEMCEHLRAALLDSVRHHLIADVPVGVFLSAGLDSTTLAALAKDAGINDLRTVTLGFKEFVGTCTPLLSKSRNTTVLSTKRTGCKRKISRKATRTS